MPVTILTGMEDRLMPVENSKNLAGPTCSSRKDAQPTVCEGKRRSCYVDLGIAVYFLSSSSLALTAASISP
jgi:hypothetical protein